MIGKIDKTIIVGTIKENNITPNFAITIKYEDGELSMVGSSYYSGGQNSYLLDEIVQYAPGYNKNVVGRIKQIWDTYHLNHLIAGSPAQMEVINNYPSTFMDYDEMCKVLKEVGLLFDENFLVDGKPYKFGSKWLRIYVPQEELEFLNNLN